MLAESASKADELVRLLGALGYAQETCEDQSAVSELASHASQAHQELARELA